MRRFFINKTTNMRDIGGYAIGQNKIVKEGKIIRTDCVTNLNNEEVDKLIEMGFTTIIDLRNDNEMSEKKSVFADHDSFDCKHIELDGKIPNSQEEVLDSYIKMLNAKEEIKEIFEILANANGGVIYHCSAGKDRTGVVTACILKFLGVDDKDIIVDYLASGVFLRERLTMFANSVKDKDIFQIINPNYETMSGLLKYIDNEYGSIVDYLKSCNISEECLDQIKSKYIKEID